MERTAMRRLGLRQGYVCPSCIARSSFRRRFHASGPRKNGVLETLEERGLVNQIAGNRDALSDILSRRKVSIYAGIDPTAPSLHLGHLLPLMVLFWLRNHGHNVVALVGGATAQVGDPSGRLTSREDMGASTVTANTRRLVMQMENLLESSQAYSARHGFEEGGEMQLLDNTSWLKNLRIVSFLRMLGRGMRMGAMLGRDTVRNKMEKGDGMSFAEFTYPLLQGWDWWHMYSTQGVQVQVGGADQYGNIVAGMDAVKFLSQNEGYGELKAVEGSKDPMGLTVPLLTTASGAKFGKSAGNAVWLNVRMTSAFDLYGFFLRTADSDVEKYLKLFTFVPLKTIEETMAQHSRDPGSRTAQHLLAGEVLELLRGPEFTEKIRKEHASMRRLTIDSITGNPTKRVGRPPKSQSAKAGAKEPESQETSVNASEDAGDWSTTEKPTIEGKSAEEKKEEEEGYAGPGEQHVILPASKVLNLSFPTILHNASLVASNSEGRRMVKGGGVYVARRTGEEGSEDLDFVPVRTLPEDVKVEDFLIEKRLVLRLGKWKVRIVEVLDDSLFDSDLFRM